MFRDCQGAVWDRLKVRRLRGAVVAVRKLKTRGILGLGGLDRSGCYGVFLGAVSWLRRCGEGGLRELSSQGLRVGHFVPNRWGV